MLEVETSQRTEQKMNTTEKTTHRGNGGEDLEKPSVATLDDVN